MIIYLILGILSYMLLTYMEIFDKKGFKTKSTLKFHNFLLGLIFTILLWPVPISIVIYDDYFNEPKI